jgi:hypothetical protein
MGIPEALDKLKNDSDEVVKHLAEWTFANVGMPDILQCLMLIMILKELREIRRNLP